MLISGLLDQIGFTEKNKADYERYRTMIPEAAIESCAKRYMARELPMLEVEPYLQSLATPEVHEYTVNLLFLLACTSYMQEKWKESGYPEALFVETMKDLKYKLDECESTYGIWGNFVIWWYETVYHGGLIALGRLQYRPMVHEGEDVKIGDFILKAGDFLLDSHIPTGGPITYEVCEESYRLAYEMFKDKIKGDILPICCFTWMFYPAYRNLYKPGSNIANFMHDFVLYDVLETPTFDDAFRLFGSDISKDKSEWKAENSLQKAFHAYVMTHDRFGAGKGLLLFDGERVLTRNYQKD